MKKKIIWVGLALALALVIVCLIAAVFLQDPIKFLASLQTMPRGQFDTISLTEADDGKTIQVKDGTFINITVPVDPNTGAEWQIKPPQYAAHVVQRYKTPEFVPDHPFMLRGKSTGKMTFHFEALGMGPDTVVLELRNGDEILQTVTVHIQSDYNDE